MQKNYIANAKFKKENKSTRTRPISITKNYIEAKENFRVSFQYLDKTQRYGSSFKDWQQNGLLSKALEVLQGYCCRPLMEQVDGAKFAIYGNFPKSTHTKFELPVNLSEDNNWARIHITGTAILAGHIINETFYIVFLDKTHKFYLTQRKRLKKDQ